MRKPCPPPELDTPRQIKVAPSSLYSLGPTEIRQGLIDLPYGHPKLHTFEVDVLPWRENSMLPCRNSKDPGFIFIVRNDHGANYTADVVRVSIGLKSLVLDYETLVRVAEEADMVS